MTALDPTPIVRELRREWEALRQYRPETVEKLIAATEQTGELATPVDLPLPRGGRSLAPRDGPTVPSPSVTAIGVYCGARAPRELGVGRVVCGEPPGHTGGHVAYGVRGRVLARWEPVGPGRRMSALMSADHHSDQQRRSGHE